MLRTIRHRLEWTGLCLLSAVIGLLPRVSVRRIGRRIGHLAWVLMGYRRNLAKRNLSRAMPHLANRDVARVVRGVFENLGQTAVEAVGSGRDGYDDILSRVDGEGAHWLRDATDRGDGAILVTGHFGNWEIATTAAIAQFPHMRGKFHFVRRALKPQWLDRLVTHRFNQARFGVFPKRDSLDAMLERLDQGDVIVFPFDQHARPPDGIEVDFFGHPAWTFKSLAIIALATGAPVLPAAVWRESDGRHVLRFEEALPLIECENTNEAIRRNTLVHNRALERLVLRHPEQWYWMQRRWKPAASRRPPRAKR